ncbi:MAG: phosphate ABC transporter permease [Colwellia sp.]
MAIVSKSAKARGFKNSLAKWLITLGGISVLFTLVLIFLYLLYVIKPIFESAKIEPLSSISMVANSQVLSTGVDELKEVAYQITAKGFIDFYQVKPANDEKILSKQLVTNNDSLTMVVDAGIDKKLLVTRNGDIQLIVPSFKAHYTDDSREIIPSVEFPFGQNSLVIDEQAKNFDQLAFAMDDERAVFVGFTEDNRLVKTSFIAEDDFTYYEDEGSEYETIFQNIELSVSYSEQGVDQILISPDMSMVFIRINDHVIVYSLDDENSVEQKALITPSFEYKNTQLTSMALLSGGSSVLLGDSQGMVSQWFEVSTSEGRQFKQVRTFLAQPNEESAVKKESITAIYTEQFRKSFYTMTASGDINVFYTTSEAHLWQGKLAENQPSAFAIAPRADGLVLVSVDPIKSNTQKLQIFSVHNEHPEVTWQALWQEVWYEGYPEPDYVWQSTSGSDDFEGKFSLVPISFGTMKAALYAMLFAVPVALTAAIYTAYFMTPGLRKKVKPTIEMMEALPTVILGFLAGLWLAPLMEAYLPAVFLLFIFLPLSTFIAAFVWHNLPREVKVKVPETLAPIILIPIMIIAAYGAFMLSPVLENTFFGGDMRQFITNDLGINFDQRNALVVGIAMGFAVIPTIFSMAEDAIFSVPGHLTSGSLALGATQWQTLIKVVLLTASPGIFSAIMMGLGRAVGETMIVLMATGNTPILDWSIFQGMRTLAANIAVEMPESEVGSSHYRILFLAAFVLFVFTFIFNTVAEFVRQHLREKYSSM